MLKVCCLKRIKQGRDENESGFNNQANYTKAPNIESRFEPRFRGYKRFHDFPI